MISLRLWKSVTVLRLLQISLLPAIKLLLVISFILRKDKESSE